MIKVEHIAKKYGKVEALQDISFEVEAGEIYGIIGPDGAGKTTLFRILTTLILADKGNACLNGWNVRKDYRLIRQYIGNNARKFSALFKMLIVEKPAIPLPAFSKLIETTII